MATDERLLQLEKSVTGVEKALAVHLAECTAAHRAVDLKMVGVSEALDLYNQKTEEYRKHTTDKITATQKLVVGGIIISVILQGLNSKDALQLLQAVVKVYFP